jgi:hypothetical protein
MPPFAIPLAILLAAAPAPGAPGGPTPPPPALLDPPVIALRLRVGGAVTIEALVDEEGIVRATNVVRSQPLLDDAAVGRVLAMSFPPAAADTPAVATIHTLTVEFRAPPEDPTAAPWAESRCGETSFHLDLAPRPDSTGRFTARWQADGLLTQELFVIVLTPDGVVVDTTGSWTPQRFTEEYGSPGWPAWRLDGKTLKVGGGGAFTFTVPERAWWDAGRIAVVALFRNSFDGGMVAREHVWDVERDAMGPLLVPDPRAVPCAAGPWVRGR